VAVPREPPQKLSPFSIDGWKRRIDGGS
jgi:hypothetical protein